MRLTKKAKEEIVKNAIKDLFENQKEQLYKQRYDIAQYIYDEHFKSDIEAINSLNLKNKWELPQCKAFYIKEKSSKKPLYDYMIRLRNYEYFPENTYSYHLFIDTKNTKIMNKIKKFINLSKELENIEKEERVFQSTLIGKLKAFSTLNQLRKAWKEGEKYLPQEVSKNIPAPLFIDINKQMEVIKAKINGN